MTTACKPTYSYSRINTYKTCPLQYYMRYIEKNFLFRDTLQTELGTLIHANEEAISRSLMKGEKPDYAKCAEWLHKVYIPKRSDRDTEGGIYGVDYLKQRYMDEWYIKSEKSGLSYAEKIERYIQRMNRQELFMQAHPELEIFDVEHEFNFDFNGEKMHGFIDRIYKYKNEDRYIIHDIKTKDHLFDESETKTPLQFIVYALALQAELGLTDAPSEFCYDLILIQQYQEVGTKGCLARGKTGLGKTFDSINAGEYAPKPSPLCYWCEFCNTNPNAPEEGRMLCPYYSLWTPTQSSFDKKREWEGLDKLKAHREQLKCNVPNMARWNGFTL